MEKQQLLQAFKDYEVYLASLNTSVQTDEEAHTPIAEGKWSISQILYHMAEWDRFIREERINQMEPSREVDASPDVDTFNREAVRPVDNYRFPEVLSHAQRQRALLGKAIEEMPEENWNSAFEISGKNMTPAAYFEGILEHDAHHRRQIDGFLA